MNVKKIFITLTICIYLSFIAVVEANDVPLYNKEIISSLQNDSALDEEKLSRLSQEISSLLFKLQSNVSYSIFYEATSEIKNDEHNEHKDYLVKGTMDLVPTGSASEFYADCREVKTSIWTINYLAKRMQALILEIKDTKTDDPKIQEKINELKELLVLMNKNYPAQFDKVDRVAIYRFILPKEYNAFFSLFDVDEITLNKISWNKITDPLPNWRSKFLGFDSKSITYREGGATISIFIKHKLTPLRYCFEDPTLSVTGTVKLGRFGLVPTGGLNGWPVGVKLEDRESIETRTLYFTGSGRGVETLKPALLENPFGQQTDKIKLHLVYDLLPVIN